MEQERLNLLFDTNIVIYFLTGEQQVVEIFKNASKMGISFITGILLLSYDISMEE